MSGIPHRGRSTLTLVLLLIGLALSLAYQSGLQPTADAVIAKLLGGS